MMFFLISYLHKTIFYEGRTETISNVVFVTDVCAGTYSGGNKRKLSTAIALIGEIKKTRVLLRIYLFLQAVVRR